MGEMGKGGDDGGDWRLWRWGERGGDGGVKDRWCGGGGVVGGSEGRRLVPTCRWEALAFGILAVIMHCFDAPDSKAMDNDTMDSFAISEPY